jgi:alkylation response protein AidB-like acyl-CoA dehydrogenase
LLPGVIERDEFSKFPTEQVKKMAELGFMGMMVDPKYGGSGLVFLMFWQLQKYLKLMLRQQLLCLLIIH